MPLDENRLAPSGIAPEKKEPPMLGIRSPLLKTILLSLVAFLALAVAWKNAGKNEGKDFYQFWAVGQSLSPSINVYDNNTRSRLGAEFLERAKQSGNTNLIAVASFRSWLQTYSSPFFYAAFRDFSTGNYDADLRNFRLLMLAGLALGIIVFCRLLNYPWAMTVLLLAVFSIWFDPLASDLYVGNVNCLQFAALAIYLWTITRLRWRYRDVIGGAILGLAVVFKPNLVFVGVALVAHWMIDGTFRRLWLHTVGGIAGGVIAVLFAAANFHDFRCWGEWLSALRTLSSDRVISIANGNASLIEVVYEWSRVNLALPLAIIFIALAVMALWMRKRSVTSKGGSKTPEPSAEMFTVTLGGVLMITASRLTWFHYYVLAIPAFIFLLQPLLAARKPDMNFILRQIPFLLAFVVLTPVPSMIAPLNTNLQAALAAGAGLILFLSLVFQSKSPHQQTIVSGNLSMI